MDADVQAVLRQARAQREPALRDLARLIAHPSVSAQPAHAADVRRCAQWLAGYLSCIGLSDAGVVETPGHPLVRAAWRGAPGQPTLLIYGHYDVQPAEPLAAWRTPPFVATLRGDHLHGLGASDDKGQLFAHVQALRAWLAARGRLPVNVQCLFEGEEETGSRHLQPYVERHRATLACDAAILSDSNTPSADQAAIVYGTRGALTQELEVLGPGHDLHSGSFGGAVLNPLQLVCDIVAQLHDGRARVAIPGFYDRVRRWSAAQRRALARGAPADASILRRAEVSEPWGEGGWTLHERLTLRPSLDVTGIAGGYAGPGVKGVIPARAAAKLGFRLVPDQDPAEVEAALRSHLRRLMPRGVRWRLRTLSRARPTLTDPAHPFVRAAALACTRAFGRPPAVLRSGGTVPALDSFVNTLRVPTVMLGFATPEAHVHAPNERLHLPTWFRAVDTSIWLLHGLARPSCSAAAAAQPGCLA